MGVNYSICIIDLRGMDATDYPYCFLYIPVQLPWLVSRPTTSLVDHNGFLSIPLLFGYLCSSATRNGNVSAPSQFPHHRPSRQHPSSPRLPAHPWLFRPPPLDHRRSTGSEDQHQSAGLWGRGLRRQRGHNGAKANSCGLDRTVRCPLRHGV